MLFVLCQNCGEAFDAQGGMGHNCSMTSSDVGYSGDCETCGHYGTDMRYDSQDCIYRHKDSHLCVHNLREEINHTGSHCLENDDRYYKLEQKIVYLEKTIMEFVEGRRAAVEATIEKRNQSTE